MQLPDFIESALMRHNTSLGNNKAFPDLEDMSFDEKVIRKRFREVIDETKRIFGYIPTIEEAESRLSYIINYTMGVERPMRNQLEQLCMTIINNILGVPQETVLLDCRLVDKIEPDVEIRIMPEDDENEHSYTFDDVDEVEMANTALLKRRMVNALVQGASYRLMRAFYDSNKVNQWSGELSGLYSQIIALNDFLLFSKQERISDRNPMLGAYVETHLGRGDEKTVISSQGLVYPLLLQETFRGFFELFGSHGLPEDTKIAMYIIRHADFLVAEAWDLRIGVPLWDLIYRNVDDGVEYSVLPYLFSSIVQLDNEGFNDTLKNIFVGTKKGKKYIEDIVNEVIRDEEYNLFKQDIEELNIDKCIITDDDTTDETEDNLIQETENDFKSWFAGSKVVNNDGTPKIMYRGGGETIDKFDRSFSRHSNLYGTGFYFTDSKAHASQYGNVEGYYLKITHPLSTDGKEITKEELYNFLVAVDDNDDYGLYNYGQGSTPESVLNSVYNKSDFAMIQDVNATCIGDMVEATLLFNRVNGTDFDGFILDSETVVFDDSQIRKANILESTRINENKYDNLFSKCYQDLNTFTTQKEKEYGDSNWFSEGWMKRKHPEINVNQNDIAKYNELKKRYDEIVMLWNTEDNNEEQEKNQTNQESIQRTNHILSLAIEQFGITYNLRQAGYILPDGRLLNFGQAGERSADHRAIEGIYLHNNIPIWDDSFRYNYVVDFMNCGAIRCDVNIGVVDMTNEPTNDQYEVIKKFVRMAGDIDMDFTDNKGNTQHSVSYSNIKPQRVVSDIYKYYNEGIKPQGNVQFEGTDKNGYLITEGISDKTYHYCSLDSLYNILKDGEIKLTMSANQADVYHRTKLFYLSTQRSKSEQLGYARNSHAECRIELDGQMLKAHGYQGRPLDYWGETMGKQSDIGLNAPRIKASGFRTPETQADKEAVLKSQGQSTNFEFEDRIFSNKPVMPLKYVIRIDCINKFNSETHIDKAILKLAEEKGVNVYFYDNKKDFVLQTNNTQNEEILASEGEYEEEQPTRTEERRQSAMSDLITNLSAMLFYYKHYNELNTQGENTLDKELFNTLNKFNLGAFYGYVQEHMARVIMFIEQYFSSTANQIRKLNTDRFSKSKISNDVMLYGQYVLNHYKVRSFAELAYYFKQHPWKQNRPTQTPIKEKVECVKLQYNGSSSYQILKGDTTPFWEYVSKEQFYNEISRQVENDEWNAQYNEPNIITHKSRNLESFKKYLQHLMHNDNFSLYDGAVILNKLFNGNQGEMDMMFGFTMQPIELDKDKFIEYENKIKWSDIEQIRNELFGNEDGYYEYRWPQSNVNESLNEDSAESAKWNGKCYSFYKEDVKAIPFFLMKNNDVIYNTSKGSETHEMVMLLYCYDLLGKRPPYDKVLDRYEYSTMYTEIELGHEKMFRHLMDEVKIRGRVFHTDDDKYVFTCYEPLDDDEARNMMTQVSNKLNLPQTECYYVGHYNQKILPLINNN